MGAVIEVLDNMLHYPQSRSHVISICLAFYIPPKIIILLGNVYIQRG